MRLHLHQRTVLVMWFQIPMRGYENKTILSEPVLLLVPNPHEGL